ncbi:hypothetical protein KR054_009468, partial [Drosophila jambulina]
MTSLVPILLACFVHLALHTTLFIQLDPDVFSNTPILGSQLFYLSVLDLLCHCQVIPGHWNFLPSWARTVLETIVVFLISEMAMAMVWLTMETYLRELITGVINASGLVLANSYFSQRLILEIITVVLSVVFTVLVAAFTNQPSNVQKNSRK